MHEIKNIIFDLGNVLLDIDVSLAQNYFKSILGDAYEVAHHTHITSKLFEKFETNEINSAQFIEAMQLAAPQDIPAPQIVDGWNSMLLEFPAYRLRLLDDLRKKYRIYLLSNTNAIHLEAIRRYMNEQHSIADFDGLFTKAYYSHLVGLRKPEPAIYHHVLKDAGILANETVFIDDLQKNIDAAKAVGIHGIFHQPTVNPIENVLIKFLKD